MPTRSDDTALNADVMLAAEAGSLVAGVLAAAFAEPSHPLARSAAHVTGEGLAAAWARLRAQAKDAPDLGAGDIDGLARLLALPAERRAVAYRRVFGLVAGRSCPAIESEWLPSRDTTQRAQHVADAAGFYRAFGLATDPRHAEHADHLAVELEFVAFLHGKRAALARIGSADARGEVVDGARQAFLADHLAWWTPAFANRFALAAERASREAPDAEGAADAALFATAARTLALFVRSECLAAAPLAAATAPLSPDSLEEEDRCSGCALE